ncbi:MAG: hypothetical protein ABRQ27_10270 [Clostridiaceae bacterium]
MKRLKITSIAVISLVVLSLSSAVLSGCSNTKTLGNQNSDNSENADRKTSNPQNKFLVEIKDSLAALVKDGTITQEQSDKILSALTSNKTDNSQKKSASNDSNGGKTAENKGKSGASGRHIGIDSKALAQLVTDRVITQAQADAVITKIKSSLPASETENNTENSESSQSSGNSGSSSGSSL